MPSPLGKAFEVLRSAKQQLIALSGGEISCILYLISYIFISYLVSEEKFSRCTFRHSGSF